MKKRTFVDYVCEKMARERRMDLGFLKEVVGEAGNTLHLGVKRKVAFLAGPDYAFEEVLRRCKNRAKWGDIKKRLTIFAKTGVIKEKMPKKPVGKII